MENCRQRGTHIWRADYTSYVDFQLCVRSASPPPCSESVMCFLRNSSLVFANAMFMTTLQHITFMDNSSSIIVCIVYRVYNCFYKVNGPIWAYSIIIKSRTLPLFHLVIAKCSINILKSTGRRIMYHCCCHHMEITTVNILVSDILFFHPYSMIHVCLYAYC